MSNLKNCRFFAYNQTQHPLSGSITTTYPGDNSSTLDLHDLCPGGSTFSIPVQCGTNHTLTFSWSSDSGETASAGVKLKKDNSMVAVVFYHNQSNTPIMQVLTPYKTTGISS